MGNKKTLKSSAQHSIKNQEARNILFKSKIVNNPSLLLQSPPAQSSASLFSRLSLSKLSPSNLLSGWPHKFLVNVQMLDDGRTVSEVFKKNSTGQDVFDYACRCLDIVEKEYFGLRYQDENNHRYWLDLSKPLSKQFRVNNLALSFRVRFYPQNPICLREEVTRYQLFVQLQRDLLHGRLHLPQADAASLAGLILQSVLGDYDEEIMGLGSDYVSEYKLLLKQSQRLEERIALAHQAYRGMTPAGAETEFLNVACKADTYGFDPYGVKDIKQTQEITIGTTVHGILIFIKNQKIHTIKWREIQKVDYVAKRLQLYPTKEYFATYLHSALNGDDERKNMSLLSTSMNESFADDKNADKKMKLKFVCPSASFAKHLWRHILSQRVFFTEEQARFVKPIFSRPRIPLFSRGSTFHYPTGRVLNEIEHDVSPPRLNPNPNFERYTLPKQKARSKEEPWNNSVSVFSTPKLSRPTELTSTKNAGQQQIFSGDGVPEKYPISCATTVLITNSKTIDVEASRTTEAIGTQGSSFTVDVSERGQKETAKCIVESSLDGLADEHPSSSKFVEEELSENVPWPERFSMPEKTVEGLELRRHAFQQQQNGGLASKNLEEELSFTLTPSLLNIDSLPANGGQIRDRTKQVDLTKTETIFSGLSYTTIFSIPFCFLIALCAFLCYHYKWVPSATRYYNGQKW